jgi:hypothetical protein
MAVRAIRATRRRRAAAVDHAHFGGHQALRAVAVPHHHLFARLQLGDAVSTQGFHMDEDIRGAVAAAEEAEAAQAVEPLDDRQFETARRHHADMGARHRQLGRMDRRRLVQ